MLLTMRTPLSMITTRRASLYLRLMEEFVLIDASGSTSLSSSVLRGHFENGRRYQVVKDVNFNIPSDEQQFESMVSTPSRTNPTGAC